MEAYTCVAWRTGSPSAALRHRARLVATRPGRSPEDGADMAGTGPARRSPDRFGQSAKPASVSQTSTWSHPVPFAPAGPSSGTRACPDRYQCCPGSTTLQRIPVAATTTVGPSRRHNNHRACSRLHTSATGSAQYCGWGAFTVSSVPTQSSHCNTETGTYSYYIGLASAWIPKGFRTTCLIIRQARPHEQGVRQAVQVA